MVYRKNLYTEKKCFVSVDHVKIIIELHLVHIWRPYEVFCDNYGVKTLVRKLTCHKNSENLTCIDLMLTDVPRSFQSTCVIETGLSDFHSIILTVMRKECRKFQSRIISYRSQRHFCNKKFRKNLLYTYRNVFFH